MGQSNEYRAQHGEYKSLDEGYQELEEVHEDHEQEADGADAGPRDDALLKRNENYACQGDCYGVSAEDVGKESNHQCERLGKYTKELDDGDDGDRHLEPPGYVWPKDILPVVLVAKEVDQQHRAQGKKESDGDITCQVRSSGEDGDESHDVAQEDEEERCQQERSVLMDMLLRDSLLDDIVIDKHGEHLDEPNKAFGRSVTGLLALVPAGAGYKDDDEQDNDYPELHHVLGD